MQPSYIPVTVVGVGAAGGRAVDRLALAGLPAVRLVTVAQGRPQAPTGPGAAAVMRAGPPFGAALAEQWTPLLGSTDLCLLLAGGADDATAAAVTLAAAAREWGVLSVALAVVEDAGGAGLAAAADAAVIIPPARLSPGPVPDSPAGPVWRADALLCHGARSIAELVSGRSLIDLDLAVLGSVFRDAGAICMGIGHGRGTRPVQPAVQDALAHPLTDCFQQGATRILLNVTVPPFVSLPELAADLEPALAESFPPGANILFGVVIDDELTDQAWVTVFAAGR